MCQAYPAIPVITNDNPANSRIFVCGDSKWSAKNVSTPSTTMGMPNSQLRKVRIRFFIMENQCCVAKV